MADSLWDKVKDFTYNHAPEAVRERIDDNRAIARLEASMAESARNGDPVAVQWLSKEPMTMQPSEAKLEAMIEEMSSRPMPDDVVRHLARQDAREAAERPSTGSWQGWKPSESTTIEDQRQTNLWQQTMEIGRQTRQVAPQQESPQEQDHLRRQLSL